jgi:hypothetical protein
VTAVTSRFPPAAAIDNFTIVPGAAEITFQLYSFAPIVMAGLLPTVIVLPAGNALPLQSATA